MIHNFKELKIKSLQKEWPLVERFTDTICEEYYVSNRYFANIMLAIEEAVQNAIVHGNRNDDSKSVSIRFVRKRSGLSFIIEDEGAGFNVADVPNPLDSDTNEGTGIFLMKSLADRVKYNEKGNRVELLFTISSINYETTINRRSALSNYFNTIQTKVKP